MRYFEELSFKEIAERTDVSINNTALGRMRYALMNMRKIAAEKHLFRTKIAVNNLHNSSAIPLSGKKFRQLYYFHKAYV